MTIFIVENSDGERMAVFKKRPKAKKLVGIGKKRWNEKWSIIPIKLNHIDAWVLAGGEHYRMRKYRAKK